MLIEKVLQSPRVAYTLGCVSEPRAAVSREGESLCFPARTKQQFSVEYRWHLQILRKAWNDEASVQTESPRTPGVREVRGSDPSLVFLPLNRTVGSGVPGGACPWLAGKKYFWVI